MVFLALKAIYTSRLFGCRYWSRLPPMTGSANIVLEYNLAEASISNPFLNVKQLSNTALFRVLPMIFPLSADWDRLPGKGPLMQACYTPLDWACQLSFPSGPCKHNIAKSNYSFPDCQLDHMALTCTGQACKSVLCISTSFSNSHKPRMCHPPLPFTS